MKYAAILLALSAAAVSAQSSCSGDYPTTFSFQTMNVTSKRDLGDVEELVARQSVACGDSVTLHLGGGVLNDARGRTGYIASNDQFQFDAPPQAGYKQTSGFQVCTIGGNSQNQRLALNNNQIFYNCLSGSFANIYSSSQGAQCYQVYIQVFGCQASSQIPTAPINTVPFPSGTLSAGSASVSVSRQTTMSMQPMTAQPMTSTPSALATPYPVAKNSTVPAPTGTTPATTIGGGAGVSTPVGTSTGKPSSFTGAANIVAVGQKVVGLVAGVAAFALF